MKAASGVITHDGASGSLAISSSTGPVTLTGNTYVDVESIRFTSDKIGLSGDDAILQLTTSGSVGKVKIDGTVEMIDDATSFTHTGTTSLAISSTNGHITIAGGSDDYVDVESVRFTDNHIGISADTDLITLTSGAAKVTGTLNVTAATQLDTTLAVTGAVTLAADMTLTKDAVALTHSGDTSLAISSTNGHITIAGGSGDYVDVESVRFTDNAIGISTDTDIMTLTSTGGGVSTVAFADKITTGALATLDSADITNAVTVGSDFTINTNKFKVIGSSGDTEILGSVTMKAASGVITHDGASGSLAISSSTGPVTLTGNTYVDVESVRFTNAKIGLSGDDDIMTLTSTSAGVNNVAFADKITTGDLATLNSATVTTTLHSGGDFTVGSGPKLTVTASSGDVVTDGKVAIAGAHGDATKALYVTGSVYATGTVTSASDARFKRDVRAIEDPLAIARALEPVTFEFRRDEFPARDFPAETQAGFLAQDLESVLPHLVSEDDGGYKGVAYERVGVYALAGVKALDDKFERRNGTVAELEARVAYLERALAALISKASGPEVAGR
jgi:hypothetical protein